MPNPGPSPAPQVPFPLPPTDPDFGAARGTGRDAWLFRRRRPPNSSEWTGASDLDGAGRPRDRAPPPSHSQPRRRRSEGRGDRGGRAGRPERTNDTQRRRPPGVLERLRRGGRGHGRKSGDALPAREPALWCRGPSWSVCAKTLCAYQFACRAVSKAVGLVMSKFLFGSELVVLQT